MRDNRITIHGGFADTPKEDYYNFHLLPQVLMAKCNGYLMEKIYFDINNIENNVLIDDFNNDNSSLSYVALAILETDYFESSTKYNFFKFSGNGSFNIQYKHEDQDYWNEYDVNDIWEKIINIVSETPVKFRIIFTSLIENDVDYFFLEEINEQ